MKSLLNFLIFVLISYIKYRYDNGSNEKIQCFLGYYGLTKSFVHQTPQKNKDLLGKSFDEAVQNYPRFLIKKKRISHFSINS